MADIELVVKIPENTYRQIQALARNNYFEHDICGNSMRRIANGKPLSKGHGKIGDLDKLIKRVTNLPKCPNGHSKMYDEAMIINIINNESAIIEADKAESEG